MNASPDEMTLYEKRVDALIALLQRSGDAEVAAIVPRIQHRLKNREISGKAFYDTWIQELRDDLLERGVLSEPDLARQLAAATAGENT